MTSGQTSRSRSRRPNTRPRRTHREPELYGLVVKNVPVHYAWQEVKDEIKIYAPHLQVINYESDATPGLWTANIRSKEEAFCAYTSLAKKGFRGGVQVEVALIRKADSPDREDRVVGPKVSSPSPTQPRPRMLAPVQHQRYMYPTPAPIPHVPMQHIPQVVPPYASSPNRHAVAVAPTSMNAITQSMQWINIGPPSHHTYPSPPPPPASAAPPRHRPTPSTSTSTTSRSISSPRSPKPKSRESRRSHDGPLVLDPRKHYESDSSDEGD